ncbi:MAG TPA: hypothetical protein VIL99_09265 [Ignavibacteria bacterium]
MQFFPVLINTTDSFEDCWFSFFKLFSIYWPEYNGIIYLNTETKDFNFAGLNIIPIKNKLTGETWSKCLISALDFIKEDHILYMQEDYFFNDFIKANLLNEFYDKFVKLNCDCLHLTDQSTPGPFIQTNDDMIWEIDKNALYRISCQAAFWKKDILISYLRKHETAWRFEHYGTKRSAKKNDKFYIVNTNIFGCGKKEIIPYVFTAIIKGKWNTEVKKLLIEHQIDIDYRKRGFYENSVIKNNILKKLKSQKLSDIKSRIKSEWELIIK